MRTAVLWRFLCGLAAAGRVLAAWLEARTGFSVESAYRWRHRWDRGQYALRARLHARQTPPGPDGPLDHLRAVFGTTDPLAAYQRGEQRPWPG